MDNTTIIALASIVTAGITTGFGRWVLRWRKGGQSRRRCVRWHSSPTPPLPSPGPYLSVWR